MKKALLLGLLSVGALCGGAQLTMSGISKKRHPLYIEITGTNDTNSDGVNRIGLTLLGVSHTSSRIDSVKILLHDGRSYKATDIDGVDFERYFQWEDDGSIPVEIDFPKTGNYLSGDSIVFYTVHGEYRFPL